MVGRYGWNRISVCSQFLTVGSSLLWVLYTLDWLGDSTGKFLPARNIIAYIDASTPTATHTVDITLPYLPVNSSTYSSMYETNYRSALPRESLRYPVVRLAVAYNCITFNTDTTLVKGLGD